MRILIIRFLVLISLILVAFMSISANGGNNEKKRSSSAPLGWGFESGRATETDVEELLADQLKLRREFDRMARISRDILGKERIKALLGASEVETDGTIAQLRVKIEKWWKDEIDTPIERIASNPAASCEEANEMVRLVLARNREKALLGTGDESFYGSQIFEIARQRCHEEALDECNLTGRYDHIPYIFLGEQRIAGLLGYTVDGNWIIETLRECAIYELHYTSTTNIADAFKLNSVIDGRIKLKPDLDVADPALLLGNLKFEGEVMTGTNPFLKKLDCAMPMVKITCSPGGEPKKSAWAQVSKMTLKSKEFYVENNWTSKQRPVGEDMLELIFSPAMVASKAVVVPPKGPQVTIPFVEVGATGFYIAHKKSEAEPLKFKFTEKARKGVYPVLFEFTRTASDTVGGVAASDTTVFELIHKPEKKPFEPRSKTPPPVRVPLKPKPKP